MEPHLGLAPSLWHATRPAPCPPRPGLSGDADADVAVVGAGLTGLWTAYYLNRARPDWRIVVIDAERVGFGASGRNGGWCSALFPVPLSALARRTGSLRAQAQVRALQDTVDEVGRVARSEDIDCQWAKGGSIALVRTPRQATRAARAVREARRFGFGPADLDLLDAEATRRRIRADGLLGATWTPHCAVIHPARLVHGLAATVERAGVPIYEKTPALDLSPGLVRTPHGRLRAGYVVRATEAFTVALPGLRRTVAPIYSLVLATEPLAAATWEQIGLRDRETFTDHRHLVVYGQRTADGRLVFGGRGAPYHFGSRMDPAYEREPAVFAALWATLVDLFPVLRDAAVTHTWGGAVAVPRDWFPSVGLDRERGLAWAGGYVGDGVAAANLAGRTLTDLILRRDTPLVHLPWVGHHSPRWEPEPLRWIGINAARCAVDLADRGEQHGGPAGRAGDLLARSVTRLTGH